MAVNRQLSLKSISSKILIIAPHFWPEMGGVETHLLEVIPELLARGWQITVITQEPIIKTATKTTQPLPQIPLSKSQPRPDFLAKIQVIRFFCPAWPIIGLLIIWGQMWRHRAQWLTASVVHVHDVMIWLFPWRWLIKGRVILTMHGWESRFPIPRKNRWLKQLSARLANRVLAVGKFIGEFYGIFPDQIILGGVNKQAVISESALISKHNWPKIFSQRQLVTAPVRLLFVGRLAVDTGLPELLAAINLLSPTNRARLRVELAGDGELRTEGELVGRVIGWLDQPSLAKEMKNAQLCFVGGYLSALQSLAAGCVTLASYDQPLKQAYWQKSELTGRVLVTNSALKLAKIITNYLNNPEDHWDQLKKNRAWAAQQSWGKIAEVYEQVYRDENV